VITDDTPGTATGPVTFTFNFGEAVTGFDVSDIDVTGGIKGAFTTVSASEYRLVVNPTAGSADTITVDIDEGKATDLAGNPNLAATQATQIYDLRTISITDLNDDFGLTAGSVNAQGGSADDPTPTALILLSDVLQGGEQIRLYRGVDLIASTTALGSSWELSEPEPGLTTPTTYQYVAQLWSGTTMLASSDPFSYTYVLPPGDSGP
jgi:hypothetical protein